MRPLARSSRGDWLRKTITCRTALPGRYPSPPWPVLADSLFKRAGDGHTKYLAQPFTEYAVSQNDVVLAGGEPAGRSTYCSYTVNIGTFASIALLDELYARDGAEVVLVWGEPDGGTGKPGVERHVQAEIRATVSTRPLT